jgi:hypothetical protein
MTKHPLTTNDHVYTYEMKCARCGNISTHVDLPKKDFTWIQFFDKITRNHKSFECCDECQCLTRHDLIAIETIDKSEMDRCLSEAAIFEHLHLYSPSWQMPLKYKLVPTELDSKGPDTVKKPL